MKSTKVSIRSMTGYAEGVSRTDFGHFVVEVHSVNRRFLEVQTNLPAPFSSFEAEVRKWVGENVGRGQVNVTLFWKGGGKERSRVTPNLNLARELKKGWDLIAKELKVSYTFSLSLLRGEEGLFVYEESGGGAKRALDLLKKALFEALQKHRKMRELEGRHLFLDLKKRVAFLNKAIKKIEALAPEAIEALREKIKKRVFEFIEKVEEERVLKEVFLFAEKGDITEEIVRFNSLLSELSKTIEAPLIEVNETKGKKLEFLLQELLREINTLTTKSLHVAIVKEGVEMKAELEKIREQVQNLE